MQDEQPNYHFEAPQELTRQERARDAIITAVLWAVYLYLWVPLVSLLAWALGFEFAYDVMVRAGGARDLLPILLEYTVIVAIIFSAFTLWSLSNRLRFKHLNRRSRRDPVPDEALAEYFRIPMSQIATMRARQVLHVTVDADGTPLLAPEDDDDLLQIDTWDVNEDLDEDLDISRSITDASATG
jgi:biofilm PGA synthesis protein PgaD